MSETTQDDEEFLPDYETIASCVFAVPAPTAEGIADCGEPATHRVWWDDYSRALLVCPDHFTKITKQPTELGYRIAALEQQLEAARQERDAAWRTIRGYAAQLKLIYAPETDIVGVAAMVGAALETEHRRAEENAAKLDELIPLVGWAPNPEVAGALVAIRDSLLSSTTKAVEPIAREDGNA